MSIQINALSHIYNPNTVYEKLALDHISLTIHDGEFIGLIGHTGSGKSTLIQHLNALLKPSSGEILYDGENIYKNTKNVLEIRQKVGLVFQYPEHQLFEMTVYKDVCFGPRNLGLPEQEIDRRARNALSIVGIKEEVYDKSPFELSGGQKRRIAIAGVLAMEPRVLILDEPTAGLDPKGRDEILHELKTLHDKLAITVILVSHSMEDIANFVERVIVINKGAVALDGSVAQVFAHVDMLEKIGLSAPQISYVMRELKRKGFPVSDNVFTVHEAVGEILRVLKKNESH